MIEDNLTKEGFIWVYAFRGRVHNGRGGVAAAVGRRESKQEVGREWKIFSTFPALASESSEGEHAQTLKAYSISLRDRVHCFSVLQTGKPRLARPARGEIWSRSPQPPDTGSQSLLAPLLFPEPLPD